MIRNIIIDALLGLLIAMAIIIAQYATLSSANTFIYQRF